MAEVRTITTSGGSILVEGDRIVSAYCDRCNRGRLPDLFQGTVKCLCGNVIAKRGEATLLPRGWGGAGLFNLDNVHIIEREHGVILIEHHPEGARIIGAYCKECGHHGIPTLLLGVVQCSKCDTVISRRGGVICALCNALLPEDGETALCANCETEEGGVEQAFMMRPKVRRNKKKGE